MMKEMIMSNPKHRSPIPDKKELYKVVDKAIDLGVQIEKHNSKNKPGYSRAPITEEELSEMVAFTDKVNSFNKPKRWYQFWKKDV